MKATPKTLASGSNNSAKQVSVNVWNNGHNVHGMTRAELQALAPAAGQLGYCKEAGREGEFVWDSADHSANVTADPQQGIYIPPTSDATGASGAWVRKYNGPINLAWFGMANGAGSNAERIENAIALLGGGAEFMLPRGTIDFDREVKINKNIILRGHGDGPSNGTICQFPASVSGFRLVYTPSTADSYDTLLTDFKIAHTSRSGTSDANVSFSSATRTATLAAAGSWANGQVVRIEAAGPSLTVTGKTAAITSGTNQATITNTTSRGNTGAYVGQHITIAGAGLPAGTTVTAVTSTTITLSNNATATVSNAAYTLKWPLFATILSGGGTTSLVLDAYSEFQDATGVTMTLAEVGIVAERVCQIQRLSFSGQHLNLMMHGSASAGGGDNVNTSQVHNCRFGSSLVCLYLGGYDSNASVFLGCDFSNYSQIGVLENSLIGNFFIGCHFAFNTGIVCPVTANQASLSACYFEDGTSALGNASGNTAYGCQYFSIGSGWAGVENNGSGLKINGLAVIGSSGAVTAAEFYSSRGILQQGIAYIRSEGTFGSTMTGASGVGSEMGQDGTYGLFRAVSSGSYAPAAVAGSQVAMLADNGFLTATFDGSGLNLVAGDVFKVGGTQVVGARKTGWGVDTGTAKRTANATYSGTAEAAYTQATIQALMDAVRDLSQTVKALKDDLHATAGHGLIGA